MKKSLILVIILSLALFGCTKKTSQTQVQDSPSTAAPTTQEPTDSDGEMYLGQQPSSANNDKLCGWIDESDIVIKVNFAEGVVKDTSYEVGFYFSPILSTMRLARSGCDYRTGFKYSEMKTTGAARVGAAEVGVRGYSDNIRRHIQGEPISLVLDDNGVPSIGSSIEVTITD